MTMHGYTSIFSYHIYRGNQLLRFSLSAFLAEETLPEEGLLLTIFFLLELISIERGGRKENDRDAYFENV